MAGLGCLQLPPGANPHSHPVPFLRDLSVWKVPVPFFHLTPSHLSAALDVCPGLDGQLCVHIVNSTIHTHLPTMYTYRQGEPGRQGPFLALLRVTVRDSAIVSSIIENYFCEQNVSKTWKENKKMTACPCNVVPKHPGSPRKI